MSTVGDPNASSFLEALRRARVMAVLRGPNGRALVEPALRLYDAGLQMLEISLTTPGACAAIEQIAARKPGSTWVGAGTVLRAGDVADVEAVGAEFVVTPALADSVAESVRRGLPVAAGAFTATEAWAAYRLGAAVVRLFPASAGGPGYLRALREPFPQIPFVAVGGVDVAQVRPYLQAGAVAVGVGSPLLGDAAHGGDLGLLADRARSYLGAAEQQR